MLDRVPTAPAVWLDPKGDYPCICLILGQMKVVCYFEKRMWKNGGNHKIWGITTCNKGISTYLFRDLGKVPNFSVSVSSSVRLIEVTNLRGLF